MSPPLAIKYVFAISVRTPLGFNTGNKLNNIVCVVFYAYFWIHIIFQYTLLPRPHRPIRLFAPMGFRGTNPPDYQGNGNREHRSES
jgi:hypothetical protein